MRAPYLRVLGRHRIGLRHFAEESLHFPGRQKLDQDAPAPLANKGPHVRNPARGQQRITSMEMEALRPHLELELALKNVEPFLLLVMQVTRRATLRQERILKDEHTVRVRRRHLKRNSTDAQAPL